jgi:hypothetical protein
MPVLYNTSNGKPFYINNKGRHEFKFNNKGQQRYGPGQHNYISNNIVSEARGFQKTRSPAHNTLNAYKARLAQKATPVSASDRRLAKKFHGYIRGIQSGDAPGNKISQMNNAFGNFKFNNNVNTIARKIQLVRSLTVGEVRYLVRLYDSSFSGININNAVNNKNIEARYINKLAAKYTVPRNWLEENPAILHRYEVLRNQANAKAKAKAKARAMSKLRTSTLGKTRRMLSVLPTHLSNRIMIQAGLPGPRAASGSNMRRLFSS